MGWETKALLAFAACAGIAAVCYVLPLPAFYWTKKKKSSSEMDGDFFEQTASGCNGDADGSSDGVSDVTVSKESSSGSKDATEETKSHSEEMSILEQTVEPLWLEDLPELSRRYDVCKTLGSGTFGTVKLGRNNTTNEMVAIKSIEKTSANVSVVKYEIDALQNLRHQHVYQMFETHETSDHIYLLLEFCPNGDLYDYIEIRDKLLEHEACRLFRQIISAVDYIHGKGYVHRDLKPENIMMDINNNIKLIDFGLCFKPEGGLDTPLQDTCGTLQYMPPEAFTGLPYLGAAADIWSLGVILYAMLCGTIPFHIEDDCIVDPGCNPDEVNESFSRFYTLISIGYFTVPEYLSKDSVWLLRELLMVEPELRIQMEELLHHTWVLQE